MCFSTESAFHPCNCADMAKTGSLTALLASIWAHNLAGWTSSNIWKSCFNTPLSDKKIFCYLFTNILSDKGPCGLWPLWYYYILFSILCSHFNRDFILFSTNTLAPRWRSYLEVCSTNLKGIFYSNNNNGPYSLLSRA